MIKQKLKKSGLIVGGLITSLAPLGTYIGLNYKQFINTTPKVVSLAFGGVMVAVFIGFSMIGKLKAFAGDNKSLVTLGIIFVICLVLEPIIGYAKMISLCLLAGQGMNTITFQHWLKKLDLKQQQQLENGVLQSTAKITDKTKPRKFLGGI